MAASSGGGEGASSNGVMNSVVPGRDSGLIHLGGGGGAPPPLLAPDPGNSDDDFDSSPISFVTPVRKAYTLLEMLGLFACSFSYAFVFNTITNIVIPKEIERLTVSRQSMWVGLIMAAGALSQLATPIVGAWSDRAGQRTSFLIYGTFITLLGIVLFLIVGTLNDIFMLFVAHIVTTVGLSVQYSMVTALLNDYVTEEQTGKGSGAMAILAILGSGTGYALFAFGVPLHYSYCCYILSTVCCLGICILYIPGTNIGLSEVSPTTGGGGSAIGSGTILGATSSSASISPKKKHTHHSHHKNCAETAIAALSMPSPSRYPDFFFCCLGRALFNTGLSGQVYLVYYLRDVMHAEDPVQITSMVAVLALFGGVVGALPSGIMSDRIGKKPVIYLSITVCVISLGLFMLVREVWLIQLVGFIYGVGNVAYLSVDYALGVQALPKRHLSDGRRAVPIDAAKDLGVFAMSATVGQLFGQVVYGAVLDQYGSMTATGSKYSVMGFFAIYSLAAVCFVFSGIFTGFIRSVR